MAVAAPAEGREVAGAASLQDRLKLGWQGLKASIEKTTASVEGEAAIEARTPKDGSGVDQVNALFAWADKARKAVAEKVSYEAVPQDQPQDSGDDPADMEKGEVKPAWNALAKAASAVKKQVTTAAEEANKGLKQGVQKAKSVEFGETAAKVSKSMSELSRSASNVGEAFQEKSKAASQKALKEAQDLKDKSSEKLKEASANASAAANKAKEQASKAKDKASAAAGAAKSKLSEAGSAVGGAVGGVASLAANPVKLAQFTGIFFVGMLLITLSFTFLPVMVVAPQKFALLFAFGSIVIMGSLAFLKGPKALASQLLQREKLPFSGTYIVSLVGTLVATIVLRSFILTALFGLTQAVALMYFLASYVPGGKAVLNFCGRCTSRLTQKVCVRSCPSLPGAK
jgi:hypothetical protein